MRIITVLYEPFPSLRYPGFLVIYNIDCVWIAKRGGLECSDSAKLRDDEPLDVYDCVYLKVDVYSVGRQSGGEKVVPSQNSFLDEVKAYHQN